MVGADSPAFDVDVDVVVNGAKQATSDFKWTESCRVASPGQPKSHDVRIREFGSRASDSVRLPARAGGVAALAWRW